MNMYPFGKGPTITWFAAVVLYVSLYGFTLDSPSNYGAQRNIAFRGGARLPSAPYPSWVHGHWIRLDRNHQSSAAVLELIDEYQTRNIPVRVVTFDAGWAMAGTMKLNKTRFADVTVNNEKVDIITALHRRGLRVVVYAVPLIPEGTDAFTAAVSNKYCLRGLSQTNDVGLVTWDGAKSPDGPGELRGCLLDYTNAAAVLWWHSAFIDEALKLGVDGFKNDAVDALFSQLGGSAGTAVSASTGNAITQREWSRLYYWDSFDYARQGGKEFDRVTSFRPVDSVQGISFHPFGPPDISFACWVGNHPASFAGMREALMNAIHSSYRGYINFGVAVGGSGTLEGTDAAKEVAGGSVGESMRRRELFIRWTQMAAFAPFLENGGLEALHAPWAVGCFEGTVICEAKATTLAEAIYRHTVMMHRALIPYYHSAATSFFHHEDAHRWTHKHDLAAAKKVATSATSDAAEASNQKWTADPDAPHLPMYPMARDVSYAEPAEFTYLLSRDLLVVPITQSALPTAAATTTTDGSATPGKGATTHTSHEVDEALAVALGGSGGSPIKFTTPAEGRWVDPVDFNALYEPNREYTQLRNVSQGVLALVRAGAALPLGPAAGRIGWQLHARPYELSSAAYRDLMLGDEFALSDEIMTMLLVNPMHNTRTHDRSAVYREHDGGFMLSTALGSPLPSGARKLDLRYTAFPLPLLLVIRGVRCVQCQAPAGFDLVPVKELQRVLALATAGPNQQHLCVVAPRRIAAVHLREPTSVFYLYDPEPLTGGTATVGPFA
jgi:hypothetical protein